MEKITKEDLLTLRESLKDDSVCEKRVSKIAGVLLGISALSMGAYCATLASGMDACSGVISGLSFVSACAFLGAVRYWSEINSKLESDVKSYFQDRDVFKCDSQVKQVIDIIQNKDLDLEK